MPKDLRIQLGDVTFTQVPNEQNRGQRKFHGAEGTRARAWGCQESGGAERFGGSRQAQLGKATKRRPKWWGGGMGRRIHNRKKESPGVLTANFPPLFYAGLLP